MGGDLPDYTRNINVLLSAEVFTQVRTLPWWVRYAPKRILYMDDFEGVLKWIEGNPTVTKASGLDTFEGTYHLSVKADTAIGSFASTGLILGGVLPSKFMLQLRWHCATATEALRQFTVYIILSDGQYGHWVDFIYRKQLSGVAKNKWIYMDDTGSDADVPNGAEVIDTTKLIHQSLMFTADLSPGVEKLGRFVTSKLDLDLSALSYYKYADAAAPYLSITFGSQVDDVGIADICVDALCLSDEEE